MVGGDPLDEQVEVVGLRLDAPGHVAQAVVEDLAPRREQDLLDLAHPAAEVVRREAHHLGAEAVEEGGVARLVHELRGQEQLDLAGGSRLQEGREVGGHALLADVEGAEAPDRGLLGLARGDDPLLAVDREVELRGLPVLALPERVELAVVEQAVAVRGRLPTRTGRRAPPGAGAAWPRASARRRPRPCARAIQRPSTVTGWIWPSIFVSWFCIAIDGLSCPDAMRW